MTEAQKRIFAVIRDYSKRNGHAPAYREISQLTGLNSPATISVHIRNLVEQGYLARIGSHIAVVPERLRGLKSCMGDGQPRQHRMIWFEGIGCPLCDLLKEFNG